MIFYVFVVRPTSMSMTSSKSLNLTSAHPADGLRWRLSWPWLLHTIFLRTKWWLCQYICNCHCEDEWAGIAQSVQQLATGWTVRGSNPGVGDIFRTRPDRPWSPPTLLYNGYWVFFQGVKGPGRGVNHPPPHSFEVKERVELYFFSPSGPSWPVNRVGCLLYCGTQFIPPFKDTILGYILTNFIRKMWAER